MEKETSILILSSSHPTRKLKNWIERFIRFFVFSCIVMCSTLTTGCVLMVDYLCMAGKGEKDVSDDFSRGHVVGKEYELLQDVFVAQYNDSELLHMTKSLGNAHSYDKNGNKIPVNLYSKKMVVPKGTRFKVFKVFVATGFSSELCSQKIAASLSDSQGKPILMTNNRGIRSLVRVEDLFKNTSEHSNENWIFKPNTEWIKCINEGN